MVLGAYLVFYSAGHEGEIFRALFEHVLSSMRRPPRSLGDALARFAPDAHQNMMTALGLAALLLFVVLGSVLLFFAKVLNSRSIVFIWVIFVFAEQNGYSQRYLKTVDESRFHWEAPIENLLDKQKDKKALFRISDSRVSNNLDRGMIYGVSSLNGYEGGMLKRYGRFMNVSQNRPKDKYYAVLKLRRYHEMLDLLNLRYIFTHPRNSMRSDKLQRIYTDSTLSILERKKPMPRAWIVHDTVIEIDPERVLGRIQNQSRDFEKTVILEDPGAAEIRDKARIVQNEQVQIIDYEPNRLALSANLESDGYLVLSEIYYPGWQATVDKRPANIYRADYLLRAVYLEKGEHLLEMSFAPEYFGLGLGITVVLLFLGLFFVFQMGKIRSAKARRAA
jgi:hypothetical protein